MIRRTRWLAAVAFLFFTSLAWAIDPVFISEFLASNNASIVDEDGDNSDWVEIYNSGTTTVNLAGWRLTDNSADLSKWVFPAVNLAPKGFLVVFASGKDRADANAPLHTNFKLSQDGGYLALVKNDGSIAHEYNLYPAQYTDKPYGLQQTVTAQSFVGPSAALKYLVPTSATPDNATWTARTFVDTSWTSGTNGVGFETTTPGFALKTYFSNQGVGSLAQAESVIATPSLQTSVQSVNHPVVNFDNSASPGHYSPENNPPALSSGDKDNYVVEATGTITVPTAGVWSFCVSSDDGCSLQIRPLGGSYTTVLSFPGLRGIGDTLGTYSFPTAGDYEIRAIVFENNGGSGGEVSARAGSATVWDSSFKLIGNTAGGGLAIKSIPIGAGGSGYTAYIGANVKAPMFDASPQKSSCYVRYAFSVANPATVTSLTMPVRFDDGYIAYLNGVEVARRNAPAGTPTNTSVASGDRISYLAKQPETIDLTPFVGQLVAGTNVLAVHGLNQAANNGDFLIKPELSQYTVTIGATEQYFQAATPSGFNTSAVYNKVAPVVASVQHGFYSTAQSVTLTCGTAGATIRYTFDGSTPVEANGPSATYSTPIPINKTTTLRYRAFKAGFDPSDTVTQTYIFTADVITQQPTGTPPTVTNPSGATQASTTWPGTFDSNSGKYQVNGQELDFGMDPDVVNNPTYSGTIQNDLKSIPTFSVVTDLPNLFNASTGIYVNPSGDEITWERPASVELIYPDGTKGFQINCGLRLRGGFSRSTGNPKHALRVFFRDNYGPGSLKYPLFGDDPTGAKEFKKFDLRCSQNYSWAFQGDGGNGVLMRDEVARDMQLAMGEPSSHGGFYHLYINGHYWGLYNIDERPDANFGESYYGGSSDDYDTIKVDPDLGYNIEATDGTADAWFSLWQLADTGLSAGNTETVNNTTYQRMLGRNSDGTANPAYPVLLDPVNIVDEMLITYWGGNLDAPISNFLSNQSPNNWFGFRNRTGVSGGFKFIMHDSEHTMLNVNEDRTGPWIAGSSASQGTAAFSKSSPQYVFQQCIYSLEFKTLFADRTFKHCYNGGVLTPTSALAIFNARTTAMDRAVVGESARWGDSKSATPFTKQTWLAACDNVRNNFIPGRTAVLLTQLRNKGWIPAFDPPVFSQHGGTVVAGSSVTLIFAPGTPAGSTIYYTIDGSDPRLRGGAVNPTALSLISGTGIQINNSQIIRTRTKSGAAWSALDEASFYVQQDYSPLAITEVHYNPLPSAVGGTDSNEFEFIELKNTGTSALDLGGLTFTTGVTFSFPPNTILPPGAFKVLVKNPTKFATRYPGVATHGVFTGSLDNAGEKLTLTTAGGGAVLTVDYDDDPPWPAAADGVGYSLVTKGTNYNSDKGENWRASANIHGSPGADDPAVNFPPVIINEALTNSVPPLKDSIELYNPTAATVSVGDWWLSDDRDTPKKYRIPAGTTIPAGGYIVFDETQFNSTPGVGTSFALSGNGDDVYLFSGDSAGNLTGYSHGWSLAGAENDVSFGRYVTSVGEEHFPRQISRTFASPYTNSGPLVGPLVLNEIMYHPYTGFDEFIEIRNLSASAVSLDGPSSTTWRVGGVNYNFPVGQSIAGNSYALLVGIDPTAFRTKYAIPAQVPIFGPYIGVLQDGGERLSLEQPGVPYLDNQGATVVPYIVIDSVKYNDKAPWPVDADGNGPSLQRLTSNAYADDPANWFASGSSPGGSNGTNMNPTVSLTGPANNATFTTPATVTFTADASDADGSISKVEFYVDGGKVGEDSNAPYSFSWTATGGVHTCKALAVDNALGLASSAPVTIYVTSPVSKGLRADYYANRFLSAPIAFTRIDPSVSFTDSGGTWVNFGGVGLDQFSVRWAGQVRPASTGTYTFYTNSDDGVRLFVNGQTLVNNWTDHGPVVNSGTIALTSGQLYTITMEFYENAGGATAQLSWSGPGVSQQIIPQSVLYPDSTPIIITQPSNQIVEAGNNATFSVVASGINNQYQWRRDGTPIAGATSATYVLQQTITSDAGTYTCLISNANGYAITNGATLTVNFTDTDGDGIQNSWETQYGLNPNNGADATQDKDGDGKTNKEEFLAGTNPNDPNDVLRPIITSISNGYKISFTAQSRKSYIVRYKVALGDTTWTTLETIPEQPGIRTIEVSDTSVGTQTARYYQVVTPSQ